MDKILSIAIPCYNSAAYMENCVNSLLPGGDAVEIIIVDDGSQKDNTGEIADRLAQEHPGIVKAVHQENGGHGQAVNTGLLNATGTFFKVVDSDDWLDRKAYKKVLLFLKEVCETNQDLDMLICNFVYDKEGAERKRVMNYRHALPEGKYFGWNDVGHFNVGQYILMHSVIYRTEMLKACNLQLPKHTFYVDNIYVYYPLPYVKTMYYMNVNLYRYYIGRDDQSVNETVMISRLDQQYRVNQIMFESYDLTTLGNKKLQNYMYQYLSIICTISSILAVKEGSKEKLKMKKELWSYMKEKNLPMFKKLRYGMPLGWALNLPGKLGRGIMLKGYALSQKLFGFN